MRVQYGIFHRPFDRWAGTRYDWTRLEFPDVLLFDTKAEAEAFRREHIWERSRSCASVGTFPTVRGWDSQELR